MRGLGTRSAALLVILPAVCCVGVTADALPGPDTSSSVRAAAQCKDKRDNDRDGKVDLKDLDCRNKRDNKEKGIGPKPMANRVLARDQRKPVQVDLFTSNFESGRLGAYPEGSPMSPATGPAPSPAQVRTQLAAHLKAWFGGRSAEIEVSLALFDDPDVENRIPHPSLRAAFAALNGTLDEPNIEHFLTSGLLTTVSFEPLSSGAIAESIANGNGTRRVVFNDRYDRESFALMINVLGHEFGHDDPGNSNAEEAILSAKNAMTHLQVLLRNPALAYLDTELSRRLNTSVLAFLNTREHAGRHKNSPDSEIVAPTGRGIFPGSANFTVPDLWTLLDGGGSSPGSAALPQILAAVGASGSVYNQATAESFEDLNDTWMTDVQRVRIGVLLQLVGPGEIAKVAGASKQGVIRTLGLKRYLAAIEPL